jgi:ribosomal protein L24
MNNKFYTGQRVRILKGRYSGKVGEVVAVYANGLVDVNIDSDDKYTANIHDFVYTDLEVL